MPFAGPEAPSIYLQPVWYRYVKVENGALPEVHYFDSEIPCPWPKEPSADAFYLVREFLLLYYAHAFHLHTRGTWTAFECADMDRDRAEHLPYCAPAQLTIPILTKWMLVFEDPATSQAWLAKAVPRLDGRLWEHFDKAGEFIVIPEEISGHVSVAVRY